MKSCWIKSLRVIIPLSVVLTLSSCGSSPTPVAPQVGTSVVVMPATATVLRGQSQQFVAQVSGPSDKTVTWSVTGNVGTIDSSGLYTAPLNDNGDEYETIVARSKVNSEVDGSAVVTLPPVTLSIGPTAVVVSPGVSHAFTATVVGLTNTAVNWKVQGSGSGTITSTGLYTAPSATGVYTVIASLSADANYNATVAILVTAKPSLFSPTGQPLYSRIHHTATLLTDGTVLVAGGEKYEAYCIAGSDFAELYNPVSGSFALTSSMIDRRYAQTSTLLQNGKVLITGGFSFDSPDCSEPGTSPPLATAELYDPSGGSFAPTGSMSKARGAHTATLLSSGKVLVTGGGNTGGDIPPFAGDGSATAEVYDPASGEFAPTANMSTPRTGQTATLLVDGKVLITGGMTGGSLHIPIATAEVYDPSAGAFKVVGKMTVARAGHTATLLPDGKVLITGGFTDQNLAVTNTAEIYDPAKASFLATNKPMGVGRWDHTATMLQDGTVLIVGGESLVAEIYSPSDDSFLGVGLTDFDRTGHTATLLKNGSVVIIGGSIAGELNSGGNAENTAELYQ